ncbi:hypothetical protein ElyMa_001374100 [Elysia marginata]|uniref:Uncharacterized protein n=1 Tax=Elysia marginata TaxID=1093978 RepID=A0AAV4IRW9_9GAST|nr:hypothetical protein ElyMa_001374100 [Elysia marginata]
MEKVSIFAIFPHAVTRDISPLIDPPTCTSPPTELFISHWVESKSEPGSLFNTLRFSEMTGSEHVISDSRQGDGNYHPHTRLSIRHPLAFNINQFVPTALFGSGKTNKKI